jgi:predicted DNA-binding protein YlxM (UPF0122 family)
MIDVPVNLLPKEIDSLPDELMDTLSSLEISSGDIWFGYTMLLNVIEELTIKERQITMALETDSLDVESREVVLNTLRENKSESSMVLNTIIEEYPYSFLFLMVINSYFQTLLMKEIAENNGVSYEDIEQKDMIDDIRKHIESIEEYKSLLILKDFNEGMVRRQLEKQIEEGSVPYFNTESMSKTEMIQSIAYFGDKKVIF